MDPLTITAAVVGLLTAAGKVVALLDAISSIRNSPDAVNEARKEVQHVEMALHAMQTLISSFDTVGSRHRMIQVDDLRIALADAMLAFSSFEALLLRMGGTRPMLWYLYKMRLEEHVGRVQRYKLSLTLMLNILQCNSDAAAAQDRQRLEVSIEKVLAENAELRQKLWQSGDLCRSSFHVSHHEQRDDGDAGFSGSSRIGEDNDNENGFEITLHTTRVYRRHEHRNQCDISFTSTAQRSHVWSALAGYSLADISVLSVIAMPLTAADVQTGAEYYVPIPTKRGMSKGFHGDGLLGLVQNGKIDSGSLKKLCPALHF
ncbi:hypothetical protein OQA88_4270 [Cercophora sp. LCS_1]